MILSNPRISDFLWINNIDNTNSFDAKRGNYGWRSAELRQTIERIELFAISI